jgi:hypothetical protein
MTSATLVLRDILVSIVCIFYILLVFYIIFKNNNQKNKVKKHLFKTNNCQCVCSDQYKLVFEDTFQNNNISKNWHIETNSDRDWTNTCAQYSRDNVAVTSEGLVLKVGPVTDRVKSGRVHSHFTQKYGVFEIVAKIPTGTQLFPAIWITGEWSEKLGWPQNGEFDILERQGTAGQRPDFSIRPMVPQSAGSHVGVSIPPDGSKEVKVDVDPEFWNTFHTYTLHWFETSDGDVMYNVYIDANFINNQFQDKNTGKIAVPIKSYSLRTLVNTYRTTHNNNLDSFENIKADLQKHRVVLNVAVGITNGCTGSNCSSCDNPTGEMIVRSVKVWKKQPDSLIT